MNFLTMQQRAWATAEQKGLHANLDGVTELGTREQALLELIPVVAAVNALIQDIKRHGVSEETYDHQAQICLGIDDAMQDFHRQLYYLPRSRPRQVDAADTMPATLIRLLLTTTEVIEAIEAAHLSRDALGKELADIIVRVGDIAQGLEIDLGQSLETVMAANEQRPHGYGTPLEKEASHGTA